MTDRHRELVDQASAPLKSHYGDSILHCFSFGEHEEDNILVIDCLDRVEQGSDPLVRVQSACYTAEIFRSTDCDCHEQLHRSLERIHTEGGLFVYMLCDGRGAGLLIKVRALAMWHSAGIDTHDAYLTQGVAVDPRSYELVLQILLELGLQRIRLLTNNPRKLDGLAAGLNVVREALEIASTRDSQPYLATKATKMGHLLSVLDIEVGNSASR